MQKKKLIRHAREIVTFLNEYLGIIYRARQDTLRIISSLEAIVLNIDLLMAAANSRGKANGDWELRAALSRTLALMTLAAANNTITMIQANIAKAQEVAAQTKRLVIRLTRGQGAGEWNHENLYLAVEEIKKVVQWVEADTIRCVAAARVLLPQVEDLQNRMLVFLPQFPRHPGKKVKRIVAGWHSGFSLPLVESIH